MFDKAMQTTYGSEQFYMMKFSPMFSRVYMIYTEDQYVVCVVPNQ